MVTQVATTTPGAGTGTFSNAVSTTLLVNRQYSYNAYAINSLGTAYGTIATFYTLANVPNAPTVNNPTINTLDVAIASADGNPSATVYAIRETVSGKYLQANGTLNATADWQTAATWGTKTVVGLTSNTSYTFAVKARNGAVTETTFSATTTSNTSIDTTPAITNATTATVFATTYGTASAVQSFSISGVNLTTPITATAPTGFLVSSDGIGYGTTATFAHSGGNVSGSLRIMLAATASSGTYNSQNIVLSSAGATSVNIATTASGNSVATAALTLSGLSASDKIYDRTTAVTITGTATFVGLKNSETFTPSGTVTWAFVNALVAPGKTVTRTGSYTVPSANYTLAQPTLTASISVLVLSTSGSAAVTSKNYDGTTAATLTGIALVGAISPDDVSISGVFNNKTINAGKPVSLSLVGVDNTNYSWTAPTGILGTITTAPLTISNVAVANKYFDGTNTATITGTLSGIVVGETVTLNGTGTFASSAVANGISVTSTATLTGTDSGNYTLTQPTGLTGNIIIQEAGLLLLEDNFNYSGLLTGNEWTQIASTATNPISSGPGNGLSYTNYGSSNIGNAAILPSSGQDIYKTFASQNPGSGASTVYSSALVQISSATVNGDYFLTLGESSTFVSGSATFRSRIFTKRGSTTSKIVFGISTNGTTINYAATEYDINTPILLAVKHTFTTNTSTSSLFINPSLYSEPNSASISENTASAVGIGLNSIVLRQGGATSAPALVIDGIRVATNWGALLGNPQYTATSNIAAGNYNTVNVISGAVTALGNINTQTLNIDAAGSMSVATGNNLTVNGAITNTGTLTIANNANLIQGGTTNTNSGNIIVNRDSAIINLYDYTLWSSPVAGQKLKAFSPNTLDPRFYTYNSVSNLYNTVSAPATTDFALAKGYLIRTPNIWTAATPTAFNGVFTGVPNNGNIELTGLTAGSYYATGNPYPSTISVASFYTANPNAGTLYFWRKTNGIAGTAYATKNNTGATASGGYTPSADIAVGQGFIVAPGAATLNFTNAMRAIPSVAAVFLRTASEERNRFWLNLTTTSGLFSQMLVGYMPEATSGVDNAIDGKYINDAPIALTSIINAEEYTIQGRALPFVTTDAVALGFKTNVAQGYTIAIDHVDGLFSEGQAILLKDNLLNTITDLSAGSYTFVSEIGTFNSRFEVVYESTLGISNTQFTNNSVIAYASNGEIRINSGAIAMEQVRVFDLQGRLLVAKKQINTTDTKITTTARNQVLLVEITAVDGSKITKKVIQ